MLFLPRKNTLHLQPEQGEDLKTGIVLPGANTATPKYSMELALHQKHAPNLVLRKTQFAFQMSGRAPETLRRNA